MKLSELQHSVMEVLEGSPNYKISRYVEWLITVVVLVNCSAVILDSIPEVHAAHKDFFHELEFWSVMFFTAEYVLRVWSLGAKFAGGEGGSWKGRKQYIFSPFGLVDFFATMPHYLHIFFPTLTCVFCGCCAYCEFSSCPSTTRLCKTCLVRCTRSAAPLARRHFCC